MKKLLLILFVMMSVVSFGQIPLMGDIVPANVKDTYPMVQSIYVQGGFTAVETLEIRDDYDGVLDTTGITRDRRKEGMFVYVIQTAKFYQLQGGIENANWVEVLMGDDVLLDLDDHVFDTIRLSNNDTKIWQLRVSPTGDTLFYNDIIFTGGGGGGSTYYIDVDRPLNYLPIGTNIKAMVGYSPMRIDSLIDMVFYAAMPPEASITGSGDHTLEYGSSNNIILDWTATKTSNPITSIVVDGEVIAPTGETQSGTKNVTVPTNTDKEYVITVKESTNLTATASTEYVFRNRYYVGIEATDAVPPDSYYESITDSDIRLYPYDDLATAYGDAMFSLPNPTGGFIVVVAPTSFGQPKSWPEGGSPSMAIPFTLQKTWDMENAHGYRTEYKMWVIPNKQNSNPSNFYLDEN